MIPKSIQFREGGLRLILLSVLGGVVIGALPFLTDKLTIKYKNSALILIDGLAWYLWLPGAACARLFYPEGIHTEYGSPQYMPLSAAFNVAIYGIMFWVLSCRLRHYWRRRSGT